MNNNSELEELRKRVSELEQALREKEAEVETLRRTASSGIPEDDTGGRIPSANPAQERRTGYTATELLGIDVWNRLANFMINNTDGKPNPVLGMIEDIAERKQAEEAWQKAHEELERRVEQRTAELTKANEELAVFRRFVEASSQGFGMATLDGEITYVNPTISRLMAEGRSEEMIGHHVSEYYSREYMDQREKVVIPCMLREGHWDGETVIPHRSGSVSVLQSSFLVRDEQGNPAYFATVLTDITERKRAEEALRQSHEELRSIYESAVDGIVIVDAETLHPVRVNAACCHMSGYSEEEVYNLPLEQACLPQRAPMALEKLESIKKGNLERMTDVPLLHKNGSIVYVDIVCRPIRYNERPCWISFIHNVTERKYAQEALEREHRTLRHLLESSDHERQLIAYDIHDGLAQYLSGAIMQFETYPHLKETKPQAAVKAYQAGMTMLRQGHFEARRLISGVRPPILDESGVVTAIAHLVNEERLRNGPEIEFHCDVAFDRLAPILENAIYRMVQEGLTNACKHSKSTRVRMELVQHDKDLCIRIRDWGVGFDPNAVEEGCFGLAGIRERARLLGGTMTVESRPGHGACIRVELPSVLSG